MVNLLIISRKNIIVSRIVWIRILYGFLWRLNGAFDVTLISRLSARRTPKNVGVPLDTHSSLAYQTAFNHLQVLVQSHTWKHQHVPVVMRPLAAQIRHLLLFVDTPES